MKAIGLPMKWLESAIELLTGHDVFISYSHHHFTSANYAPALADSLQKNGLDCHIDQWGSKADKCLPEFLKQIIRRSRVLVVLGSLPAYESSAIEEEIQCFKEKHNTIVPVELDKDMHDARWWKELEGLLPLSDPQGADPNNPSEQVVQRIVNSCRFVRARKRRKIAILSAVSVILVTLIGLAISFFYLREAQQARNRAVTLSLGSTALQIASRTDGADIERGLLLAAESYRRDPNVYAFQAIRRGLSLLPQFAGRRRILSNMKEAKYVLSPDGTRLLLYDDDILKIIDVADGKSVGSVPGVSLPSSSKFSPEGEYFVTSVDQPESNAPNDTHTNFLQVLSTTLGQPKAPSIPLSKFVDSIALGPSGDTFAACVDNVVRFGTWKMDRDNDLVIPLKGTCTALTISPNGRHVAIGSRESVTDESNGNGSRSYVDAVLLWDTHITGSSLAV